MVQVFSLAMRTFRLYIRRLGRGGFRFRLPTTEIPRCCPTFGNSLGKIMRESASLAETSEVCRMSPVLLFCWLRISVKSRQTQFCELKSQSDGGSLEGALSP
jgi:hypothetical protein